MARDNPFQRLLKTVLCDYAGITVTELAKRMKVSRDTIYTWKNGEEIPTEEKVNLFCELLDIKDKEKVLAGLQRRPKGRPKTITEKDRYERKVAKYLISRGFDPVKDRKEYRSLVLSERTKPLPASFRKE